MIKKILGMLVLMLMITSTALNVGSTNIDNPPVVVIQSPSDGSTLHDPEVTLTGYASDDHGIVSIGAHHEWTGDQVITSGTISTTTYYPFTWDFELHQGWNRITIFVYDTLNQYGEDQIVLYYTIVANHPPNQPSKPSGPPSGTKGNSYRYESYFSDPDGDSMEILFVWGDGETTGWIGPVASGSTVGEYHTWTRDGTFEVKTKARDVPHNEESVFSDSLSVSMPKTKSIVIIPFYRLFENHLFLLNILQNIWGL